MKSILALIFAMTLVGCATMNKHDVAGSLPITSRKIASVAGTKYFACALDMGLAAAVQIRPDESDVKLEAKNSKSSLSAKLYTDSNLIQITLTDQASNVSAFASGVQEAEGTTVSAGLDRTENGSLAAGCEVVSAEFIHKSNSSFYNNIEKMAEQKAQKDSR